MYRYYDYFYFYFYYYYCYCRSAVSLYHSLAIFLSLRLSLCRRIAVDGVDETGEKMKLR